MYVSLFVCICVFVIALQCIMGNWPDGANSSMGILLVSVSELICLCAFVDVYLSFCMCVFCR